MNVASPVAGVRGRRPGPLGGAQRGEREKSDAKMTDRPVRMIDLSKEYRNARKAQAGWCLNRRRGRLTLRGRDATAFLHALVTADVEAAGRAPASTRPTSRREGRMISDMALYHRDAETWLADVPVAVAPVPLATRFDALIFAEEVRVADVSPSTATLSVVRPGAGGDRRRSRLCG